MLNIEVFIQINCSSLTICHNFNPLNCFSSSFWTTYGKYEILLSMAL